jgi:hypothetical protein
MSDEEPTEILKKVVGEKKPIDVWSELYRLNIFAANLGLLRAPSDGYPVRKVVGKPRES